MKLSEKLLLNDENVHQLVQGKRVFIRVDFNVPIDEATGEVKSDLRIKEALPTINLLSGIAKQIILASHLGRPDGRVVSKMSLKPVAKRLSDLLGRDVLFAEDCVGPKAEKVCQNAPEGSIILLENLRFHIEEEGKGKDESGAAIKATADEVKEFRKQLQSLADVYVNDAFGTAHRAHSSMVGFESFETRAGGLLIAKEIRSFASVLETPKKPVLTILGGAKVSDKIKLINNLLDKTDMMIIGGGMAFTFLKVLHGMKIGQSLFDEASVSQIDGIMKKAAEKNVEIIFPVDFTIAPKFDSEETKYCEGDIPDDMMGLDCGKKSIAKFAEAVKKAQTILWNGPPGVFEKPQFAQGSLGLLEAVCASNAVKIAGGGDTTSLVLSQGKQDSFTLVSTGGGASLELLEGKDLPGIVALSDKK